MAPASATKALASAKKALKSGDHDIALDAIVAAWRARRCTELAELAELLSASLAPHVAPLEGRLIEFQPAWLAVAKRGRAVDFPHLLGSVLETTHRFGTAVVTALLERGKVLERWPADPRSSALIVSHLKRGGYESTSRSTLPFWTSLFAMLKSHADPRTADLLRRVRFARVFRTFSDGTRRIAWFQERADELLSELGAAPKKLTQALARQVVEVRKEIKRREPSPAAIERVPQKPARARTSKARPSRPRKQPSGSLADHLANASSCRDEETQLRHLLDAWRVAPNSDLASLVGHVSARVEAKRVAIRGTSRAKIQKAWLEIALKDDPSDLPRLLRSITDTMGRSTDALLRVQTLASRPADPRTGAHVVEQLEVPAFHASSTLPFWKALIGLAADHVDSRITDSLEGLASRFDQILAARYSDRSKTATWFRGQLSRAVAMHRALPEVKVGAADRRKLATLAKRIGDIDRPFLVRIAENPDDDDARHVYADRLQERGDPRGEFIALQLANQSAPRIEKLAADHADIWVGALRPFLRLDNCRFERGFLSHAALASFEPERLTTVAHDSVWATVRTIHLGAANARRFPATSSMRLLKEVKAGGSRGRSVEIVPFGATD